MKNIPFLGDRVRQLAQLGAVIDAWLAPDHAGFDDLCRRSGAQNPWFTKQDIVQALEALRPWLTEDRLHTWAKHYGLGDFPPLTRRVLVVMAGNLPLVNFHDALAVLLSGHQLLARMSHQDSVLLPHLLCEAGISEDWALCTRETVKDFDAVIATGSGNTGRYFEHYFSKYPKVLRKNRQSFAVLSGEEQASDLEALAHDMFRYYGLGCRNVSLLWVPQDADIHGLIQGLRSYAWLSDFSRFRNNYDYQKAAFLVNKVPFYEGGFFLLRPSEALSSPPAVVHLAQYQDYSEVEAWTNEHQEHIQCSVGYRQNLAFGESQMPGLMDYPDGIDTMAFLKSLRKAVVS